MLKIKKIFFILLIVSCYFVIEGFFIPGIGNIGNDIIGGWIGIINDRKIELNAVYDVSAGSTCLNHYCIEVTYETNNTTGSVESGVFNGTKAKISPSPTVRTPKIYR